MYEKIYKELGLLYCINKESTHSELTEKYTGRLDMQALLKGNTAIWQAPAQPEIFLKKKIVIVDYGLSKGLYSARIEPLWDILFKQGFELYVWTGQLEHVTSISMLNITLRLIPVIHTNDVYELIGNDLGSKKEWFFASVEQTLQLVNHYLLRLILGFMDPYPITIDEEKLNRLAQRYPTVINQEAILNIQQPCKDVIVIEKNNHELVTPLMLKSAKCIIVLEFEPEDLPIEIPQLLNLEAMQFVECEISPFFQKMLANAPNLNVLAIPNGSIPANFPVMFNCSVLDIYIPEPASDDQSLKTVFPNLRMLIADGSDSSEVNRYLPDHLEILKNTCLSITESLLTPSIKNTLREFSCYQIERVEELDELENLEVLEVDYIPPIPLLRLCSKMRKLRELRLGFDHNQNFEPQVESIKEPTGLKSLSISQGYNNIEPLLENSPGLREIVFDGFYERLLSKPLDLKYCDKLSIKKYDINLLKSVPNLLGLTLTFYVDDITSDWPMFSKLHSLTIFGASVLGFQKICNNVPQLKILKLKTVSEAILQPYSKELKNPHNHFFLKNLASTLQSIKGIEVLNLEKIKDFDDDILFRLCTSTSGLKHIELIGCTQISLETINAVNKILPDLFISQYDAIEKLEDNQGVDEAAEENFYDPEYESDDPAEPPHFEIDEIFYSKPHRPDVTPHCYRLSVKPTQKSQFPWIKLDNPPHSPVELDSLYLTQYAHTDDVFYGKKILRPTAKKRWLPLPSLDPSDEILIYHTRPAVELQFFKNTDEDLIYVEVDETGHHAFQCEFILKSSVRWTPITDIKDSKLRSLAKDMFIRNDSCMKRSKAFARRNPGSRVAFNIIHAFIEFSDTNAHKLKINLGGLPTTESISYLPPLKYSAQEEISEFGYEPPLKIAKSTDIMEELLEDTFSWEGFALLAPIELQVELRAPIIKSALEMNPAGNRFMTWNTLVINASAAPQFYDQLFNHVALLPAGRKNVLLRCDTKVVGLLESFHECAILDPYCFYVDDLDDISEYDYVILDGSYQKVPSQLVMFLKVVSGRSRLVINWSKAKARHMSLNSLFEPDRRQLFNKPLPAELQICAIVDVDQKVGDEIYSRVPTITTWPRAFTLSAQSLESTTLREIPFYDEDWQSVLFGKPSVDENGDFVWIIGAIHQALEEGAEGVQLRNPPYHLTAFRLALQKLVLSRTFYVNGCSYSLPTNFMLTVNLEPYELNFTCHTFLLSNSPPTEACYLLNNENYEGLFSSKRISKNGKIKESKGVLQLHQSTLINIYLTESLTPAQWRRLLSLAELRNITLKIYAINTDIIPQSASSYITLPNQLFTRKIRVLQSSDPDYTAALMDGVIVPVYPTMTRAELVENVYLLDENGERKLVLETGPFVQALKDKMPIILKGNLSAELAKALESLNSSEPYIAVSGEMTVFENAEITLICSHQNPFVTIPEEKIFLSQEDILKQLRIQDKLVQKGLEFCRLAGYPPFTWTQWNTMSLYHTFKSQHNPFKPLLRLHPEFRMRLKALAEQVWGQRPRQTIKENVTTHRLNKIDSALARRPFVFLVGPSGAGKSTLINKELLKHHPHAELFCGLNNWRKWLNTPATALAPAYLYFPEANRFAEGSYDFLESILLKDPYFYLQKLPPFHYVIMDGNYGDVKNRQHHRFFEEYGQIISIKDFSDEFLRGLLRSILCKIETDVEHVLNYFIKTYHELNKLLPESTPLTPRNLEMMALRFVVIENPSNSEHRAMLAVYDEVGSLLSTYDRKAYFNLCEPKLKQYQKQAFTNKTEINGYRITRTRLKPLRALDQAFLIREFKIKHPELASKGTCGIIFEGEPGTGKTELAEVYLKHLGYMLADENTDLKTGKYYFNLSAVNDTTYSRMVIKALHAGIPVIDNEMNTRDLEGVLNNVLSGVDSDQQRAKQAGFIYLGTQNAAYCLDYREEQSAPLLNRFQKVYFKQYSVDELVDLARFFGCSSYTADRLVEEYESAVEYAAKHHKTPAPNARNFTTVAKFHGSEGLQRRF